MTGLRRVTIEQPGSGSARVALARTLGFALLYLLATVAGRMTVMDSTNLSLVWPAAGVAVLWFRAQRHLPTRWVDVTALSAITLVVNMATGASAAACAVFVAANLAQAWGFVLLLDRWRPTLLTEGFRGPRDLSALLAAAFLATLSGTAVGPTGLWLLTGHYSWLATAVWLARNITGILLVGAVGLCLARGVEVRRVSAWRVLEYAALAGCSVGAYVLSFAVNHGLPLAFMLIALTVWAALRLPTAFVAVHDLLVGTIAVVFTLQGDGPFATLGSHSVKALMVQLFIVVVAGVGLALSLGRDERVRLIAELATEKEHASERAELMGAIIDSMGDGLVVIDRDGRIALRNPASARLMGGHISPDDTVADSVHYGLFHPDGTPFVDAEMPHRRVLAGESVSEMDVLVRNAGVPEGRIVSVTVHALPDGHGSSRAVLLYHDVTAERRQVDELTGFAGVVAHDLLNPLAAVEGWTGITHDTLADVPPHPAVDQARDGLTRVVRAATRMRGLINDLLAYTTTRDATMAPIPLSITAVALDIAGARADASAAAGMPAPRFAIGRLEPVHADPVLVRQLLDNLVGNAVKYTAPGSVPEVSITASRVEGMVQVTIADRGIGVPAGQHDAIFDNFHRAHRAAGYTGTGLGLAICKRIVERHGGVITATDNPGGGTRFTFTLPAAIGLTTPAPAPSVTV
ncbi:ATP-binding protein [Actinokineospora enzanensis]|uniref:ATP-binding protein n=1 Tax=Actinokineospora enzanensis TaxID=155975 RepID=UPI00039DD9E9